MSNEAEGQVHQSGGEAGGTAFCDFYHPVDGYRIGVSARDVDVVSALEQLRNAIKYAQELGLVMLPPTAPRKTGNPVPSTPPSPTPLSATQSTVVESTPPSPPATGDQASEEGEVIDLDSGTVEMSANGQVTLKVKGGKWGKFGVIAWPEVAGTMFDLENMAVGQSYDLRGYKARLLMVDGKPKKVLELMRP